MRSELENLEVTLDMNFSVAYKGKLDTIEDDINMRKIDWTNKDVDVPKWIGRLESSNGEYAGKILYHPSILLAYRDGNL